jgi:RNA polymerase sigma-70 factor (ECF subfamily)
VAVGKTNHFELLFRFVNGDADDIPYDVVAPQLGLSVGGARTAVHRMRRRYRDLIRAEIAETVSHPDEIDDEIRFLLSTLSKP